MAIVAKKRYFPISPLFNINKYIKTSRAKIMKNYLIVVEKTETGFQAYSDDIPGCIATGSSKDEVNRNIREAIEFHLEGLELEGLEIPEPQSYFKYYKV